MLALCLVLLGPGLLALRFGELNPQSLLVHGASVPALGTLLHSLHLEEGLERLLSHTRIPFTSFYNSHCRAGLDAGRYQDLVDCRSYRIRMLALNADCLSACKVLVGSEDVALLPESPLLTSALLPEHITRQAFTDAIHHSLHNQHHPHHSCKWLFNTNLAPLQQALKKIPDFWKMYHPACYIRYAWEGGRTGTLQGQWEQTRTFLVDAYHYVTGLTEMPEFARWVVQLCLVALNIKRYHHAERVVLADIELALGNLANQLLGHPLNESLYAFEKEYLRQIGCLVDETIKRISPRSRTFKLKTRPSFTSLLGLVQADRHPGDLTPRSRVHWELMAAFLFGELFGPDQVTDTYELYTEMGAYGQWPSDMVMLFAPFTEMCTLDMVPMRELVEQQLVHSQRLQRYVLQTLHRTFASQIPALEMPMHLRAMVASIPARVRVRFVRELALSYYGGYRVDRALRKYRKEYGAGGVWAALSGFFSAATRAKAIVKGEFRVMNVFWNPASLRILGYFIGMALIYDVPLRGLCRHHLSVLLGYDHRYWNGEACVYDLFEDLMGMEGEGEARQFAFNVAVSVTSAFHTFLCFPALLSEGEVMRALYL